VSSHDFVTDAGVFLQFFTFEQLNVPPMRVDDASLLKFGCNLRDSRSPHSEHPAQELMSKRNRVTPSLITRLQKPTG